MGDTIPQICQNALASARAAVSVSDAQFAAAPVPALIHGKSAGSLIASALRNPESFTTDPLSVAKKLRKSVTSQIAVAQKSLNKAIAKADEIKAVADYIESGTPLPNTVGDDWRSKAEAARQAIALNALSPSYVQSIRTAHKRACTEIASATEALERIKSAGTVALLKNQQKYFARAAQGATGGMAIRLRATSDGYGKWAANALLKHRQQYGRSKL